MKKFFQKTLTWILIFAILLNYFPIMTVLALNEDTNASQENSNSDVKVSEEEPTVLAEDVTKRTKNEKHFFMSDGSNTVAIYSTDVHYEKDGKLVDIDNTLVDSNDEYSLKSSPLKVKFFKNIKDKKIFSLENKGFTINWSLAGITKAIAKSIKKDLKNSSKYDLNNLDSQLTYNNVLPDTNLSYEFFPNYVKENIILTSKEALKNSFVFELDTTLTATMEDNNTIVLKNKKEEIFIIDAPIMYDAANEVSDKISLKLSPNKKGYTIELVLDNKWLNDEKRVYPIVIDPTIITARNYESIEDTFIYGGDTNNTSRHLAHVIRIGSNSLGSGATYGTPFRGLIKFTLPQLSAGDQVIDATLKFYNYHDTSEWTPPTTSIQVDVHKMTGNWDDATANWNNTNTLYDAKVVDYFMYSYSSSNPNKENNVNITSIVKDWYVNGYNYGIMIKEHTEYIPTGRQDMWFLSADTNISYINKRPAVIITYRNQTGLEGYLSYHSQDVGRAGTVHTNDYNGNLSLLHADASTSGERFPASINHVYNSNDKTINKGYGNGFRLNLSQTIESIVIGGVQYYLYCDEDGTRHYFYQDGSVYRDEDGLFLTLTLANNIFTMEDKEGNKSTFTNYSNYWRLTKITDTNNNTITINYSGDFISSVVDATGKTITLTYSNNLLSSIKDASNRIINYYYTSNNLTSIKYYDNLYSYYTYVNNLITNVKNVDNTSISYDYYSTSPNRVKKITEYGNNQAVGNSLTINYSENTTKFTDNTNNSNIYTFNNFGHTTSVVDYGTSSNLNEAYGKSYSYGTSGNIMNKLTLDGKLIKPVINHVLNGNGEYNGDWSSANWGTNPGLLEYSTSFSYYGKRSFKFVNTSSSSVFPFFRQQVNLTKGSTYTLSAYIKTVGVQDIGRWTGAVLFVYYQNTSGTTIAKYSDGVKGTNDFQKHTLTFEYPTDIVGNLYVGFGVRDVSGTAYFDGVQLEEGKVANNFNLIDNPGFQYSLNNTSKWTPNGNSNTTTDKVVTVDNNNVLKIYGDALKQKNYYQQTQLSGQAGDVYNISGLVKSMGVPFYGTKECAITVGVLNNNDTYQWIRLGVNSDSSGWQYTSQEFITQNDYKNIIIYLVFYNNSNEVYFDNIGLYKDESGNAYSYDDKGNVISTKDMSKQNTSILYDKKNQLISSLVPTGAKINYEYDYNYKNRLTRATSKDGMNIKFNYDSYGNNTITKISESPLTDSIDPNEVYYIKTIPNNLYVGVQGSVNTNGSNIELMPINTNGNQEWKFIDLGNGYYSVKPARATLNIYMDVKDAKTTNGSNIQIWTSNGGNNQKFKLVKNSDGTYQFKPKHSEAGCIDVANGFFNVASNIQYYTCNNTLAQSFYVEKVNISNLKYIENINEYSTNSDNLTKQKDSFGNEITYNYNTNGTISSILDSKGKSTNYSYDTLYRLASISKQANNQTITNSYTYNNDNLLSISHNGFAYNFIYDNFGNTKQIKVGNSPLITNTYASNNGNLLNSTYGNNQTISYEYDRFNRISKKTTNNNIYEYSYDARGNIGVIKDNNTRYSYAYDLGNRLINVSGTNNYNIDYKYGTNSNISNITYRLLSNTNTISHSYDNNARISNINYGNNQIAYQYDKLSRLIQTNQTSGSYTNQVSYEYKTIGNKTSTLLSKITTNGISTEYIYDSNNNIIAIKINGVTKYEYSYDELNELIQEDNAVLNKTIKYTYDLGGNITSKQEYQYKTTTLLTAINYTYNTTWKDQLATYNGNSITYDNIGNPLTYSGNTYTWTNGRELSGITGNGKTISYKYSDEGIRTTKTVNGVTTTYYLEGTKVVYEQTGSNLTYYLYDSNDNIIGLKYNNTTYYYQKNGQNDIIGLLNSNYSNIISYEYDSWGKLISIKDSNGNIITDSNNIGLINPYRYRSYRYDNETGYYYLQSRYYNPEWGRFLNADEALFQDTILGNNLYSYTENNPINRVDDSGQAWYDIFAGAFNGAVEYIKNIPNNFINTVKSFIKNPIGTYAKGMINGLTFNSVEYEKIYNIGKNLINGDYYDAGSLYGENLGQATIATIGYGINKIIKSITSPKINVNKLNYTKTVLGHPDRPYINSPYTIQNIIKYGNRVPDQFVKGAYKWTARGSVIINGRAATGNWELVINPANNTIYHYLFKG